ncbi:hypothetical protein PMI35_01071 [Pseudomonas sp. GM78]|uniref:pyocin knob domain-containing protein n=1 Tax=Pseudomonas sp. GM78 TaxID=1144337 RepID=UPI00026F62D6|nr:pyocin knob domain-containing protein [Pseudomonas sp. GM78]EJN32537.1 hypothetical protein PMI35_01071 [Pseudomonas sp. GM78]
MPWYKSGTVSVTQNSNSVIGAGTAFIANARVGDAFRGPDGGWYEITNIASDTALSISPNYQGATTAAGVYALAPMQGYVKDSADTLRALVNQFGAKMAALGTTGNYDILPLTKGGTGGTDAASARVGLGLGNGAMRAVQTSSHDATAGALLMPGAFGWGMTGTTLLTISDANGVRPSGLYYILSGSGNMPIVGDALLEVKNLSTVVIYQTLTYWGSRRKFERIYVTNAWSVWDEIITTSNLASSVAFNQVGSYSFLKNLTGAVVASGAVVAGSSLSFSDTANSAWGAPTGAWRAMSATANNQATLFMRVS